MNTTKINENAEAADPLTARAANLALMNALTDQQKADFTENVAHNDTAADAIALGGNPARLVDDEWRRAIGGGNPAASEHARGLETLLSSIDGGAQYLGETWDGADPEEGRLLPAPLLQSGRLRHRTKHVPDRRAAHGAAPRRQLKETRGRKRGENHIHTITRQETHPGGCLRVFKLFTHKKQT